MAEEDPPSDRTEPTLHTSQIAPRAAGNPEEELRLAHGCPMSAPRAGSIEDEIWCAADANGQGPVFAATGASSSSGGGGGGGRGGGGAQGKSGTRAGG